MVKLAEALSATWHFPTQIMFGPGRVRAIADACGVAGISRPLVVTDPTLARLDLVARAVEDLKASGRRADVFADVRPNPNGATVAAGLAAYRAGDHDGIVAIGGGSSLDTGKAVAFMAGQDGPLWDFAMADFSDADGLADRVRADGIAPVVSVPSTAGTGSEIGRAAAIVDETLQVKKALFHARLMPRVCVADPELTLDKPADLTAATGMDALSHNIEAYCCPFYHPMSDGLALEGLRLIKTALPRAVGNGADLAARGDMMAASLLGGAAFQKGVGGMHALSHPCSGVFDLHHGLVNAVVMPYVLAFNREVEEVDRKLAALARYLGLAASSATAVIEWTISLRSAIGIPHTLADLGIGEVDIARLAPMAAADVCAGENPRPFPTEACAALYRDAIQGDLRL
jgi:alcohol dehydrogenase class IV